LDTDIFLAVAGHFTASGAWWPTLDKGFHIEALAIFKFDRGGNQFSATHATQMDFFGLGHLEPPTFCCALAGPRSGLLDVLSEARLIMQRKEIICWSANSPKI
jgi:hypothetical protein